MGGWEDGNGGEGWKVEEKEEKKENRKRKPSHHCLNREGWAQVHRAQRRRLGMQLISLVNGKQKKKNEVEGGRREKAGKKGTIEASNMHDENEERWRNRKTGDEPTLRGSKCSYCGSYVSHGHRGKGEAFVEIHNRFCDCDCVRNLRRRALT